MVRMGRAGAGWGAHPVRWRQRSAVLQLQQSSAPAEAVTCLHQGHGRMRRRRGVNPHRRPARVRPQGSEGVCDLLLIRTSSFTSTRIVEDREIPIGVPLSLDPTVMRDKFLRGVVDRHSHLTSLPMELREMVVNRLSPTDVLKLAQTSRGWAPGARRAEQVMWPPHGRSPPPRPTPSWQPGLQGGKPRRAPPRTARGPS
jgi:hypothetical protein